MAAIRRVEDVDVEAGGAVLRYGWFYGPGAIGDRVEPVRRRQFPVVGGGAGHCSWVHLDDAASATVLAVEQEARGVFNIVDDEAGPGEPVAALPGRVRGSEAAAADPHLAGPTAGRGSGSGVLGHHRHRHFPGQQPGQPLGDPHRWLRPAHAAR